MLKEFIICTIILILIFVGNGITQGYSRSSIENINEKLAILREEMNQEEMNQEEMNQEEMNQEEMNQEEMNQEEINEEEIGKHQEEIDKQWEEMFSKLAYYIEHEELEKVSRNLENIKTYIDLKEYDNATKEINEVIYILNHIEDKYSFNLQNIF